MKKILLLLTIFMTVFSCDLGSGSSDKSDKKETGETTTDPGTTEPVLYDIVFDGNGGEGTLATITKKEGESVTLPANVFTWENHEFLSWNTAKDGSGTEYKDLASLTVGRANITLYAQWKDLRFITKWDLSNYYSNNLAIPVDPDGEYDFTIDWGDGSTPENYTSADITGSFLSHQYSEKKIYTVTITGKMIGFGYIYVPNTIYSPRKELIDIVNWGNVQFHNKGGVFEGTDGLVNCSAKDFPDTSKITNMTHMFKDSKFNGDISKWDVSNVEFMDSMFQNSNFNGDISGWNTSKVINMGKMFDSSKFNGDISKWNTSSVWGMYSMFNNAVFNGDVSAWNTSKVQSMARMFYNATNFNCGGIDITSWKWDVNSVYSNAKMFTGSLLQDNTPAWYSEINDNGDK